LPFTVPDTDPNEPIKP